MKKDSVELLKECDAGITMGVAALNKVVSKVEDRTLSKILTDSKEEHENLKNDTLILLGKMDECGKPPQMIAQLMSDMKITVKLAVNKSDSTVCELIKDGCNMGIKSLKGYIKKYENADKDARRIADRTIDLERELLKKVKEYI